MRCVFLRTLGVLVLFATVCPALFATTWYVRPDGGTRYSEKQTDGQCDGQADAPYPGSGKNKHCAFKDARSLWTDGSYSDGKSKPGWGWVGAGGDTYILRGSIADKVSYRVGQNGPNAHDYYGLAGDPYGSGAPVPPSGTAEAHTRILGGSYENCSAQWARTQLHGGYGVSIILNLRNASYVDVACLDFTDFSDCGMQGQANGCHRDFPLSDYAATAIAFSNTSAHDTLTDVRVHGLASAGMSGPTGDGVVLKNIDLIGNASSGWNADPGNGTTGTGKLLVQNYNISWNGCAEEYPIVHELPYKDCTDDNGAGYGDGFGTATSASNPGWQVTFDHGIASYNTQDGLDALHIVGGDSSMTVKDSLAFGNMGQQIKIGGAHGVVLNNQIVTNCNAMRQDIPGTPKGYNAHLSDFCRAADAGIVVTVNNTVPLQFEHNTIFSANATAVEVECAEAEGKCSSAKVHYAHNTFVGFPNNAAHGYGGGSGELPNAIYIGTETNPFTRAGSVYTNNITFHGRAKCPAPGEKQAICGDPHLVDESWHNYGYGDMKPAANAAALLPAPEDAGLGETALADASSLAEKPHRHRHAVEALGVGVVLTAAWTGVRRIRSARKV